MASERPPIKGPQSIADRPEEKLAEWGIAWRDYAIELEKRTKEVHDASIPFASFLRNVPQDQGGAIERIVMTSDVLRLRAALAALREILPRENRK